MTILVYSTLTAADLPTGTPESVGMSASRLAHLDTVLEEEIAARLMPNDTALMHRVETLIYQAIVD
jgi:hypothetical protein